MSLSQVVEIDPTEDEACCCCDTDNVKLYKWTDELRAPSTHQHCELCYDTDFGSRCRRVGSSYGDAMDIMRHITQLEHIRRREHEKARKGKLCK